MNRLGMTSQSLARPLQRLVRLPSGGEPAGHSLCLAETCVLCETCCGLGAPTELP